MSFSFGSKKQTTSQSQTQDPYAPAVPYLKNFLTQVGGITPGTTASQDAALARLESNAGNPYASKIGAVADKAFNATSQAPVLGDAYDTLKRQIGGYADGNYVDPSSNPYIQNLLKVVSDDVQSRTNQQFAAAGRDLSGINQQAVARGVTQAQAPILLDQYNRGQQTQIGAAQDLFSAGNQTATGTQALDDAALNTNAQGVPLAQAAVDASKSADNEILALEQQKKQIPLDDLSTIGPLLAQIAGLGGSSKGKSTGKATSTGFSFSLSDLGKIIAGV